MKGQLNKNGSEMFCFRQRSTVCTHTKRKLGLSRFYSNCFQMKKILFILTFLISGIFSASASLISLEDDPIYNSFIQRKDLWICSSTSFPVDLAKDAFYTNYSTTIGSFTQVVPGKPTEVIASGVSGIFNVTGRPAGIYEFIFTSNIDDFCGMNRNQQSVVRVYLVPELIGFSSLTNICAGETVSVDLSQYLPFEIKNFAEDMGWKVVFSDVTKATPARITPEGVVSASIASIGVRTYSYKYDDSGEGSFKDMFKKMNPVYRCQDSAFTMHNVRVRDAEVVIPSKEVTFCLNNLMSVPQNMETFDVNLKALLGVEAKNGVWSTGKSLYEISVIDAKKGLFQIHTKYIADNFTLPYVCDFKYEYDQCDGGKGSTYLNIVFSANLVETIIDSTKSVCRNYGSGSLDLGPYFGFSVPNTAGIWIDKETGKVLSTGSVNLDSLKVGSVYNFSYRVNPASDYMCKAEGLVADLTLRVRDAQVLSGVAKLCKAQYESKVSINLYNHVQGLSNEALFDRTKIEWEMCTDEACTAPVKIVDAANFMVDPATFPLSGGIGTWKFTFRFTTDCGPSTGSLYLSVVDDIGKIENKSIQICYTDDLATSINLYQLLGVAGLDGKFKLAAGSATPSLGAFDDVKGIFNAFASFDTSKDKEEYIFEYKADASDKDCITQTAQLKIVVTKTVVDTK